MKNLLLMLMLLALALPCHVAQGAARSKIIFIPHDDRPISYHQTVEVVESATVGRCQVCHGSFILP